MPDGWARRGRRGVCDRDTSRDVKRVLGGQERAQEAKHFAAQADDLSSIPGVHGMEGENPLLLVVL